MLSREYLHRDVCASYHLRYWWHFAHNDAIHGSSAVSVHPHHELGRPAVAFLPMSCSQAGSDRALKMWWNKSRTIFCRCRRLTVSHARWAAAGALHCWRVKNTAQISRIAGSSFWVKGMSRKYAPLIFTPASTNIRSISPNLDTPMDTITDLLKLECVCSRHCGAAAVAKTWIFWRFFCSWLYCRNAKNGNLLHSHYIK